MDLIVSPLSDALGGEITGGDFSQDLMHNQKEFLYDCFLKYHLLCIRSNKLSPKELYNLAITFGTPFTEVTRNHWDLEVPEISILNSTYLNLIDKPKNPKLNRRNGWHTDHSFKKDPPKATILHAHEIPSYGEHTRFCNTNKAYEDLPKSKKAFLNNLNAVHCYDTKRAPARPVERTASEIKETPNVIHPLILKHDETNIKSIYFNANRTDRIVGYDRKESDKTLDEIDLINSYSINKFDKDYIFYEVIFNGTTTNFINIMNNKSYNFDTQKKVWILK